MAKILIVEDEIKIARFVELELAHEGYTVEIATDGRQGLDMALAWQPDLIVLDLMLPGLSGIEVCRRVRQESRVPIIMLTAKDDVSDKVMGLDMGADDYMTKPFAIEELLARIRTALKRQVGGETRAQARKLTVGELTLDPLGYTVTYRGAEIALTKKEFDLLAYLMARVGQVVTRDELLDKVWGYAYAGDTNIVDVYIRYLRTKVDERVGVKYLRTVRGVGYVIKDEDEKD
ncbi:MAG: response regulator transcription factor [Oscillospiraceae bacterium]|jgi:DNA-binding response OmpR family regulator|nr:response regulator transcription factor [Oscillospiraceae bacterium]